jgi:hypothetical protein
MRAMAVVVFDEHRQGALEMPRVDNEQPVYALGPDGQNKRSAIPFASGV